MSLYGQDLIYWSEIARYLGFWTSPYQFTCVNRVSWEIRSIVASATIRRLEIEIEIELSGVDLKIYELTGPSEDHVYSVSTSGMSLSHGFIHLTCSPADT